MEDHREREGKLNGKNLERETNHERLWTPGNKLRVTEGRGGEMSNRVMGIKEGLGCDEHWLLDATNESVNTTSKTNDVLICWLIEHNNNNNKEYVQMVNRHIKRCSTLYVIRELQIKQEHTFTHLLERPKCWPKYRNQGCLGGAVS